MAEGNWKDRFNSGRDEDRRNIQDWMYGDGSKVFAALIVVLAAWFVISLFI